MKIQSTQFITGITQGDELPETGLPQVAFIGRSNVGKSSVINSLTAKKGLARPSATAGFTKQINFYLINKRFYLVDLPGYGYAQGSIEARKKLQQLIEWYLRHPSNSPQIIVLIVDANVGVTELDKSMLVLLEELEKNIIVVANKVDKIKKSEYKKKLEKVADTMHPHIVIPYSSETKVGIGALTKEIIS